MKNNKSQIFPSLILAGALILCTYLFVTQWKSNVQSTQTIEVTGSAKKDIKADLGILRGTITVEGKTAKEGYALLMAHKPILFDYLEKNGIAPNTINSFPISNYPLYETNSQGYQTSIIRSYNYSQRFEIQSTDVEKIKNISIEISSLIENGVNFMVEQPEYYYTKLSDIKISIQAEAAKDAMNRAKKIAEATGKEISSIKDADMGVLQITPKNSNNISDYGMNDVSSIEKEITAVVHAHFFIK